MAARFEAPLTDLVFHGGDLDRPEVAQPALFAFQVALFRLYEHHGAAPDHLVGRSVGEVAAAHLAGVLDLPDAAALVSARARLLADLPRSGVMARIGASEAEVVAALGERVSVAAVTGQDSTVVSGDADAVAAVVEHWRAVGRPVEQPRAGGAFHSHHCDPLVAELARVAERLVVRAPALPVVSTLVGAPAEDFGTADYWARQLRGPVRLHAALTWLAEHAGPLRVIRSDGADAEAFLADLARAHGAGRPVDWTGLIPAGRPVELPTYPFQREVLPPRGGRASTTPGELGLDEGGHPLLGTRVDVPDSDDVVFTGRVCPAGQPWSADRTAHGVAVLPGAALLDVALHAARRTGLAGVAELVVHAPPGLDGPVALRARVSGTGLVVHAREDEGAWTRCATGVLAESIVDSEVWAPAVWPPAGAEPVPVVHPGGLGPAFQGVRAVWRDGTAWYADLVLPQGVPAEEWLVHPALLEAAALLGRDPSPELLAHAWRDVVLHHPGRAPGELRARALRSPGGTRLDLADAEGAPVASIGSVEPRAAAEAERRGVLFREVWEPCPTGAAGGDPLVLDRRGRSGADVAGQVERARAEIEDALAEHPALVVLTRDAVAVRGQDRVDPVGAALRGAVGALQVRWPGRIVLVDAERAEDVAAAVSTGREQVAVRGGTAFAPRLVAEPRPALEIPDEPWRLEVGPDGVVAAPRPGTALEPHEVRVAVRATGIGFRDARAPRDAGAPLGSDLAGVVAEVGADVDGLAVGDRVFGLADGPTGPEAVVDQRSLVPVPAWWTFAEAASVPSAFLTAHYALRHVVNLQPGQRVLVHEAAGGVGAAVVLLALATGAEVWATARPDGRHAPGLPAERVASCLDLGFRERFPQVDVVVNALPEEFAAASLELLRPGGYFVELGGAPPDLAGFGAVRHRVLDLAEVTPDRVQRMLSRLVAEGVEPLPATAWDVRRAPEALGQAGKAVLVAPRADAGAVLVVGGGPVGTALARHLAGRGWRVVLAGRRDACAVAALREELGAAVVDLDLGDGAAVRRVLAEHAVTGVVHVAQEPGEVFTGAWRLHEAAGDLDLFVLCGSARWALGGDVAEAAAWAFLAGIALERTRSGLVGRALAWGRWPGSPR
ncbi:Malonyl CoA-acyl carrier protein transacylase [Actinosynnema pretiosum subsp. pretiosum]|nr:Malonyl CoA-acyl carrier protein transacylase [Actinosynnema pretiosum subsp. pretiosum]